MDDGDYDDDYDDEYDDNGGAGGCGGGCGGGGCGENPGVKCQWMLIRHNHGLTKHRFPTDILLFWKAPICIH